MSIVMIVEQRHLNQTNTVKIDETLYCTDFYLKAYRLLLFRTNTNDQFQFIRNSESQISLNKI